MWQGVMKAWSTLQYGIEQHDPGSWAEIAGQPIFGNRFLTSNQGVQWGTEPRTNMRWWMEKKFRALNDKARPEGDGWRAFPELLWLRCTRISPSLYAKLVNSIPWDASLLPDPTTGQWLTPKENDGSIQSIFYITKTNPVQIARYHKEKTECLRLREEQTTLPLDKQLPEVRVARCGGPKRMIIDYNPTEDLEMETTLWLWGADWISNLEWDPKEWQW